MTSTTEARVAAIESELGAERTHLATKADIAALRGATTKADIAALRGATKADIAELRGATKADSAELRTDIAKLSATLTWRMIIVAGVVQTLIAAAVKYLP